MLYLLFIGLLMVCCKSEAECVRHNMDRLLEFKQTSHEYYLWTLNSGFQLVEGYETPCNLKDGSCEKMICAFLKNITQYITYVALIPQIRPIICSEYFNPDNLMYNAYIISYGFNITNKVSPMTSLTSSYNIRYPLNNACNILQSNDIIGVIFMGQCSL
jgi:hypothetical protein